MSGIKREGRAGVASAVLCRAICFQSDLIGSHIANAKASSDEMIYDYAEYLPFGMRRRGFR
jgi:hypothetical protein